MIKVKDFSLIPRSPPFSILQSAYKTRVYSIYNCLIPRALSTFNLIAMEIIALFILQVTTSVVLPDFSSQLWRSIWIFLHSCKIKSGSGLGSDNSCGTKTGNEAMLISYSLSHSQILAHSCGERFFSIAAR